MIRQYHPAVAGGFRTYASLRPPEKKMRHRISIRVPRFILDFISLTLSIVDHDRVELSE
jgi:hypothetical protein